MSFHNEEEEEPENDAGMLLNLSQKSSIFVADQTPTPTRLIKNCEEVGLFDDLRNVNPFEETFRRACEQNIQNPGTRSHQADEESLHTPQVFPQFDTAVEGGISAGEDLTKHTLNTPMVLDATAVDSSLEIPAAVAKPKTEDSIGHATKYRPILEKPVAVSASNIEGIAFLPSTVQFIQPQLITVTFPSGANNSTTLNSPTRTTQKSTKSHPLILPKLSTKDCLNNSTSSSSLSSSTTTPHPEPSSASLTPTSQLPIKERLKAILNQSSKSRPPDWPDRTANNKSFTSNHKTSSSSSVIHKSSANDTMERRRAASCRYRQKMRNEHKELKKRNTDLQMENEKLRQRVKQLEGQLAELQSAALQPVLTSSSTSTDFGVPAQLQIPASTIHLVMNIPKIVVPCGSDVNNTQTILKNPITYRIDKN
uniref:BZIP domain-containing protein n=1 Tax=Stomoxys calcitrans TaxID=35570 RepID=A0A1I8PHM8_STOCA